MYNNFEMCLQIDMHLLYYWFIINNLFIKNTNIYHFPYSAQHHSLGLSSISLLGSDDNVLLNKDLNKNVLIILQNIVKCSTA